MNSYDKVFSMLAENKRKKQARKKAQRFATAQETKRRMSLTPKMREVEDELKSQGYGHLKLDDPKIASTARDSISLHRGKNCVGNTCRDIVAQHATETEKDLTRTQAKRQGYARYRGSDPTAGATREKLARERPDNPT